MKTPPNPPPPTPIQWDIPRLEAQRQQYLATAQQLRSAAQQSLNNAMANEGAAQAVQTIIDEQKKLQSTPNPTEPGKGKGKETSK